MIFLFLIISFLIFGFLFLWSIFLLDSFINGHTLPTSSRVLKELYKIIENEKGIRNFYDLGCAYGSLALKIKKRFPNLTVFGIDNNFFRIFCCKLKVFLLNKKVYFIKNDVLNIDLSKADILYIYLYYDILPVLENKILKEAKKDALIITNTVNFNQLRLVKTIKTHYKENLKPLNYETLFIYKNN